MYDLVVIGAGPGGTRAALCAVKQGLKVALIERGEVGGVCLNAGCIPTKTLVHAASLVDALRTGAQYGVNASLDSIDGSVLFAKKDSVVTQLRKGSEAGIRKQPYDFITGEAFFVSGTSIVVNGESIEFKYAIIATGSRPREIEGITLDGVNVLNSRQMLSLGELPQSIVIIGGGYIGCEWASILATLGCKVTVVEMTGTLLPLVSSGITKRLEMIFKKKGITVLKSTKVMDIDSSSSEVLISLEGGETLSAEKVLVSVGRAANIDTCALERSGVMCESGFIKTDAYLKTNIDTIYAIGDVVNSPQLAHTAFYEAEVAVKNIVASATETVLYNDIPNCIFTDPEIAFVGTPERTDTIKEVRVPFGSNGKAQCESAIEGTFILYVDKESGLIMGAEMMGKHAAELISYVALAMKLSIPVGQLARVTFPHPTFSEIISDAFQAAVE